MEDVEFMVNNHADVRSYAIRRAEARRKKRQHKRMLLSIAAFALVALCMVILGKAGAVHQMLAAFIYATSAMAACFTLGMYVAMLIRK